ncbi:hypothetical protein NN561_008799 [Cricetulus griseus]
MPSSQAQYVPKRVGDLHRPPLRRGWSTPGGGKLLRAPSKEPRSKPAAQKRRQPAETTTTPPAPGSLTQGRAARFRDVFWCLHTTWFPS